METLKPDLMAASSRTGGGKRILAQLEHGARTPSGPARAAGWHIDGWTIGLCALLLLMCGVAWLMHDQRITPETFRSSATATTMRRTPPARPQERPVVQPVAQAAAIVNLPPPAAERAPTPTAATVAVANAATVQQQSRPRKPVTKTSVAAAAPPAQASGDTDITLLTALVAHGRALANAEQAPPAPPATARRATH